MRGLNITLGMVGLLTGMALGQESVVVKNFKAATGYYPPPHIAQMKGLLQGEQAQRQPDGRYLVTQAKLGTFREDGQAEMSVEAPECFYDETASSVSSPGPVQARTGNGAFSIAGEGFLWQTNYSLFISNRVHSIIFPRLLEPPAPNASTNVPSANTNPIEIFSDRFDYETNSGLGNYRGSVRVSGTNLAMSGGTLTFEIPMNATQENGNSAPSRLQNVSAEQSVILDYGGVHATAERATYATATGLAQLSGHPAWRTNLWEGRGEQIVVDRTNKILRTMGEAYLKMPAQNLGASGFILSTNFANTNQAQATNGVIEILADNYELRTNSAFFRQSVEVAERVNGEVQGTMICGKLDAAFSGTNQVQGLVAQENVVIQHEDQQFTADKAEYVGSNAMLELTGHPAWQAGLRQGKGDLILVFARTNEMVVRGNARMRLPASEVTQGDRSAGAAEPLKAREGPPQFADIFSERYSVRPTSALFEGGVYLTHPQMNWVCQTVRVHMPATGETARGLVAEQEVAFDLLDETGLKTHGTGDQAVYAYNIAGKRTNETLTLTGVPARLQRTTNTFENTVIVLDRTTQKLHAPGKFRMFSQGESAFTNKFHMPKTRWGKKSSPPDAGYLK